MQHHKYFLIEPLSTTPAQLVRFLSEDELVLCCSANLMSHEFADKSGWTNSDICHAVKLAYLAQTLDIFQDAHKRAQAFGSADISETVFDRWWSIKPIEYLGRTSECSHEMGLFADNISAANSPVVTSWLQQLMSE